MSVSFFVKKTKFIIERYKNSAFQMVRGSDRNGEIKERERETKNSNYIKVKKSMKVKRDV